MRQLLSKSLGKAGDLCGIIHANLVGFSGAEGDLINIGIYADGGFSSANNVREIEPQLFLALFDGRAKETESNANALALLYKDQFTGRNIKITDFIMVAIGINDVNTEFFQMVIAVIRAAVGHRLLICRLLIYRLLVGGLLVRGLLIGRLLVRGLLIGRLLVYGLLVCLLNRRRDRASASETEAGRIL